MSKLITVFGATGNQGGSVIKYILADPSLSKEYKIRGITRDISKPSAQALAKQGVELVAADLNSPTSVASAIAGSHTVFLVTNYWETGQPAVEIAQGKTVADASKAAGVSHLIFSSLLDVSKESGGKLTHVPHFDGKAEIEQYIKDTGVPCTFVLPGYFMSNYVALKMLAKQEDGSYLLAYPVGKDSKFPLIGNDIGLFVRAAIKHSSSPSGKHILAAADYYTPTRIVAEFEEVTGKKAVFVTISEEQYKSYLPSFMAQEMLENHLFIENPGYYAGEGLGESLALLDAKPMTWKDYVVANKDAF